MKTGLTNKHVPHVSEYEEEDQTILPGLMKSERPKSINFIGAFSSLVVKRKFCPNENNYVSASVI